MKKSGKSFLNLNSTTISAAVVGLSMLAVVAVGGCVPSSGTGLVAKSRSSVADVPTPTTFALEEMRSRSWTDGTLRFVDHLYKGDGEKAFVIEFFEKQMPMNRWSQTTKQLVQGRATIDFVKDKEKCRITVYGDGSWGSTYIEVAIWPSRGGAKK
ncbi:MAG: hypothetical protein K8S55_06820 [Phycisphaerae bacterium]|nr:hypothetical protein [Phycisphaerae bacterium]